MADLFFSYAPQAGVLSFDSRDSRGVIMNCHGWARVSAPPRQMTGRE
jgi:hypothetical protein